ncbi:MAG: S-layer homology domain-containing protein [Oscillibacter sp.]|nr:S-layer homology domain-containing protein [Oscillibacter sp.]
MKKKLVSLLLAIVLVCGILPMAAAVSAEKQLAAETLYELGLFRGTGTNEDGTPVFDLEKTPTRNQAIIMLVRLLGKEEEALAGTWELPFTDVAKGSTAYPYIGYAYTHGLTNGTSATTYSGTNPIKANQYIAFVLRALGYVSGEDFKVSTAWELSDKIGLTDGRYTAAGKTFLRGDIALISAAALETKRKDSDSTLAEKLINDGVFTRRQYADIPELLESLEPQEEIRDLYFVIDGQRLREGWAWRGQQGKHIVEPFWKDGSPVTDYDVVIENINDGRTTSRASKNADGSFTVDLKGDFTVISVYYVTSVETVINDAGEEETVIGKTKTSLPFQHERAYNGLYFVQKGEAFFDGDGLGDNFSDYFVCEVMLDGRQIDDYQVTVSDSAPVEASIQPNGTLLLRSVRTGTGYVTITAAGYSATYKVYKF